MSICWSREKEKSHIDQKESKDPEVLSYNLEVIEEENLQVKWRTFIKNKGAIDLKENDMMWLKLSLGIILLG